MTSPPQVLLGEVRSHHHVETVVVEDSDDESALAGVSDVLWFQAVLVSLLNFNYTALSRAAVRSHYVSLPFCGSLVRTGNLLFLRPLFLTPVRFTGLRSSFKLSSTSPFISAC